MGSQACVAALCACLAGRLLIAADYSQMELRILAHLSQDKRLIRLLNLAGKQGDVFERIAVTLLRGPACPRGAEDGQYGGTVELRAVTKEERDRAKRVMYGGLGSPLLASRPVAREIGMEKDSRKLGGGGGNDRREARDDQEGYGGIRASGKK